MAVGRADFCWCKTSGQDGHQAAQPQLFEGADFGGEHGRLVWGDAVLLRLAEEADLYAYIECIHVDRPVLVQYRGCFATRQAVHPVYAGGHSLGLTRLHTADKMPDDSVGV